MLEANELHRRFVELMQQPGLIRNLTTDIVAYEQNGVVAPASVNDYHPQNCYVVSPLTQIIYYARDELPKVESALLRYFCFGLTHLLEWPFKLARVDRLQVLNNQCLSTNFYSANWRELNLRALREQALHRFPNHALMLRSLNARQHPDIIVQAREDGWLPIISRQVYLFLDREQWWNRNNTRADDRLLRQPDWSFKELDPDDETQMARAEQLYNQLYLEKYSLHNVRFSADYLSAFSRSGLLKLFGLFHQDELLGVAGLFGVDQTLTAPVVGYDTRLPAKMALYRRIMAFVIRYAMDNNLELNLSSGAPDFKKLRGAEAAIEYSYVYVAHLGPYQRAFWRGLSLLTEKLYRPILEKFEL
ncbi:GNAT family N-acetyltransferase [Hahella sp. HN01]|uniref:GNAT family N-acetyltransferase n=1 Tax=Hahella sp. HN01 TaxID=2847262 RepID=UPI001C1E9740|nr:GNAT family N-acetyltransferase [Hahella sp. HN01]MBU6952132.1 GNAT family N-acetyltransferase [Hahella sp. HN01]